MQMYISKKKIVDKANNTQGTVIKMTKLESSHTKNLLEGGP